MNKSELIDAVAGRLGEGRSAATKAVDAVFEEIQRAVSKGERVALTGFGVFEKRDRAARIARNPATGAKVKVKKTSVPAFRAGQGFKDVVSGARKMAKVAKAASGSARSAAGAARTSAAGAARATASGATTASSSPSSSAGTSVAAKTLAAKKPAKSAAKKSAAGKSLARTTTAAKKAPAKKAAAKKATARKG